MDGGAKAKRRAVARQKTLKKEAKKKLAEAAKKPIVKANGKCAPSAHKNYEKYGTCLPPETVVEIAKSVNKQVDNPFAQIPTGAFNSMNTLKEALNKKLNCKDELCWVQNSQLDWDKKRQIQRKLFRPIMPESWKKNPNEWLSNEDILNVMNQYNDQYPAFQFLNVFSVDFFRRDICRHYNFCDFNLFDFLETGKTSLGMVINTDTWVGGGKHWIALFADFDPKSRKFGMCFYNSGATKPPGPVREFMDAVYKDAQLFFKDTFTDVEFKKKFQFKYNIRAHQKGNTECGMFSMLFLIACLDHERLDYNSICNLMKAESDDEAQTYRRLLFYDS